MLTVTLGLDGSGNNRTRRPLGKVCSVMPSIEVPFLTPAGGCEKANNARARTAAGMEKIRMAPLRFLDYINPKPRPMFLLPTTAWRSDAELAAQVWGGLAAFPTRPLSHRHLRAQIRYTRGVSG